MWDVKSVKEGERERERARQTDRQIVGCKECKRGERKVGVTYV